MPRMPPKSGKNDKVNKHRVFNLLIYPDSESYDFNKIIEQCKIEFMEYAYILHDSDFEKDGTQKKEHVHFVGRCKSPRSARAICKSLNFPENFIEVSQSWRSSVRYLIHLDNNEKTAYDPTEINTNTDLSRFLQTFEDELSQAEELLNYIMQNEVYSISSLMRYAIRKGLYSVLRRNSYMWIQVIQEKKEKQKKDEEDGNNIISYYRSCRQEKKKNNSNNSR